MSYEEISNEITIRKQLLAQTDYQTIKYVEGQISDEEYTEIKERRQKWRDEVNEYEALLESAETTEV